jgi:hypothetical protein
VSTAITNHNTMPGQRTTPSIVAQSGPIAAFTPNTTKARAVGIANAHPQNHSSSTRWATSTASMAAPRSWMPTTRTHAYSSYGTWLNTVTRTNRGSAARATPSTTETSASRYRTRLSRRMGW